MQSWLDRITPEDRIYYTRLIFSIISAAIGLALYPLAAANYLLGIYGLIGFGIGLALIILSYFIAIYLLGVDPAEIGGHTKGLIKGLGTAALLFLVIWLLGFNFIYSLNPTP